MAGILKVKDGNTWVDIPAIVGPQGVPGVQGPQGLPGPKGDPGDVQSVAGKTGAVTLDAGDVEYNDTDTYAAGSVGAGLADLKSQMSAVDYGLDNLTPYDTTRFTTQYATISTPVYDHGYTVVATGSGSATPRISYVLPSAPDIATSDIMYLSFEMYIDAESTEFAANLYQPKSFGHSFGATPISPKQWTLVQKRYTQGATINATGFYAGIDFIDRATASGKTVHLRNMICVDLTKAYGAGQEPDIETINAIVAANDGYFDRYNLFDARKITDDVAAMSTDISNIWDSAYVDFANLYKVANPDNPNDGSIYASKSSATNVAITAGASSSSAAVGDIVYVYGEFKPYSANNNCAKLSIANNTGRHADTSNDVLLPQNDTWYPMSACFVVNNTYAVQVVAEWEQNASIRIYGKHVVAINLTNLFGAYNEPTKVALDRYVYAVSQANAMDFSVVNAKMLNLSSPSRMLTHPYGSYAVLDDEGNFKAASVPYSNWSGWQDIGTYGQNNVADIPIYNRFHGTVETDGMISVLPIWGCWSNNAASTGNSHHGGHVFHGWTTDRMHRLTMVQNIYSDDEAAVFNYIPGDKSDTSEGVFLPLRLGADNVYKGMLIEPIYAPDNLANYRMSRVTVYGRLNIGKPQNYNHIPASASADGVKGDICVDGNYIYVCTDTNVWKRVPLETW